MNTTQCPRPGLEPGPLDRESSALTMRQPRLTPTTGGLLLPSVRPRITYTAGGGELNDTCIHGIWQTADSL